MSHDTLGVVRSVRTPQGNIAARGEPAAFDRNLSNSLHNLRF
jgi:hypothetical protein